MKLLSLDISTHTGWSTFIDGKLSEYGLIETEIQDYKAEVRSFKDYPASYPQNFLNAARDMAAKIATLVEAQKPDAVVTEDTSKASQRFSQKYLEWTHYCVATYMEEHKIPYRFLTNRCWRLACKCYLKEWPEYVQWNKTVSKAKKKAIPTKSGAKVAKIDGKIVTKIDQKKLSIIIANAAFGLETSDDNIADSLNLGHAALALDLFGLSLTHGGQCPNQG
jgi:hypothetical protein